MILIKNTTHLDSSESIINSIQEFNPDIIGVELCNTRLNLMVINPMIQEVIETKEVKEDSLLDKISKSIKKKADDEKIVYGSDQITASRYALDNKIQLECLDRDMRDIQILMNKIPNEELIGFTNELIEFEKKTLTEQTKNLNEDEVIKELKNKYPMSYEILVFSRNLFMENKILKLIKNYPNKRILIFFGKGHKEITNNLQ